jgi:hypothetical protein
MIVEHSRVSKYWCPMARVMGEEGGSIIGSAGLATKLNGTRDFRPLE